MTLTKNFFIFKVSGSKSPNRVPFNDMYVGAKWLKTYFPIPIIDLKQFSIYRDSHDFLYNNCNNIC
jgi:hypothetical protein